MSLTTIGALAAFSFAMSATPGPNNLMLAAAGARSGLKRSIPLMLGIEAGMLALLLLVGTGLAYLATGSAVQQSLKLAGSAYLLWLAACLWMAETLGEGDGLPVLGFWGGAIFQVMNPKTWMMAVGSVAAFAPPGAGFREAMLVILLVFGAVGLGCSLFWIGSGVWARRLLTSPPSIRRFNRGMSLLTAGSVMTLFT